MKKDHFIAYYAKLSNVELLKILREKEKYRPDAIEAAKEILSTRTYSEDENSVAMAEVKFCPDQEKRTKRKSKQNKITVQRFYS